MHCLHPARTAILACVAGLRQIVAQFFGLGTMRGFFGQFSGYDGCVHKFNVFLVSVVWWKPCFHFVAWEFLFMSGYENHEPG